MRPKVNLLPRKKYDVDFFINIDENVLHLTTSYFEFLRCFPFLQQDL